MAISYANLLKDQPEDNKLRRFFTIAYPDTQFRCHHQAEFLYNFLSPVSSIVNDQKRTNVFLIGSSCGLVLCTTSIYDQIIYYVCNPHTKEWVSLPPPPPRENNRVVTGIICNECCSSSLVSKSYKAIRILKFAAAAKEFEVEIFSSDLGEWNTYDVSCPQYATWNNSLYDNLLTHNGVFYWFQQRNRNILTVCVNRNPEHGTCGYECRLVNMPNGAMDGDLTYFSECLGESEGLICFARFTVTERSLSVRVLDGDWYTLHRDIRLHDRLDGPDGVNLITEIEVVGINQSS